MSHPTNATEVRIDQVLEALRITAPPSGLEQRVAARIAQAAEARTTTTSLFAVILNAVKDPRILFAEARLYTVAAALTLLLAITTITVLHHRTPPTAAQSKPIPTKPYAPTQPATVAQASGPANTQVPQGFILRPHSGQPNTQVPQGLTPANTQVPQGFSLGSHIASKRSGVLTPGPTDPDTIALAETLAPSRPAPPMPLTQQERLMLSVLRSGDQEEIAALNPAERDAHFAQDQAAFQNFFAPPTPATTTGDKE